MNISEANDTATVLDYLLNVPHPGLGVPSDERARAAAERLAERVRKALHAGLRPEEVTEAWPNRRGGDT